MVDGCRSKLVNVVSGVNHGSVLRSLLFLLYASEFFPFWRIGLSVMPMIPLSLLCHPQALESQLQRPWTATSARLVSGVTFVRWNWMRVRLDYDSHQITHNAFPVTTINYWRNCAEGVWWPWYIRSHIRFRNDFWEASSICFQSSFSKTLYLRPVWGLFRRYTLNYWSVKSGSGAGYIAGVVLQCNIAHRRSVAVLWMLYEIRCNPMQHFYFALPLPYVPACAGYTWCFSRTSICCCAALLHLRTSLYCRTFIPLSASLWNNLGDPACIRWCGTGEF